MISKSTHFLKNDPNKSRDHEVLSFGDLELDLEGHLQVERSSLRSSKDSPSLNF